MVTYRVSVVKRDFSSSTRFPFLRFLDAGDLFSLCEDWQGDPLIRFNSLI